MYQSALNLAKSIDISDSMPRRGGRQTTRANHPAETPKQYWRISLYYPFFDNLITKLKHVSLDRRHLFVIRGFHERSSQMASPLGHY